MRSTTIKVGTMARVEGEGALYVKIRNGKVTDLKFNIYEPPRFFEGFLRGRMYSDAPDITSRICGICPIAYQMSAVHAMEMAFGVEVGGQLRALRRLLYCGEWISSHTLHIYMLHAPDFLGYEDAIRMAKDHPGIVQRGLRIKKIGNALVTLLGGRDIHPINVRVGGLYRVPSKQELDSLLDDLVWARDAACETVQWVSTLPFPRFERDYEFVALRHPDEYPMNEGRLVSNKGLNISIDEYEDFFQEEHVGHSNALHSVLKLRGAYFVGPLARFNLNFDMLSPLTKEASRDAGFEPICRNPFQSIVIRAIETVYACDEAIRIIRGYVVPETATVEVHPRAATGYGCTEAPRGILYHRYRLDEAGMILDAKIVPPTSQNQRTIEDDLRGYVENYLDLPQDKLTWQLEQSIRNYDPCISCATHFLKLEIDRT